MSTQPDSQTPVPTDFLIKRDFLGKAPAPGTIAA
jgi:hypothetical protein